MDTKKIDQIRYAVEVGPFACRYDQTLHDVETTISTLICVMPKDKDKLREFIIKVQHLTPGKTEWFSLNIPKMDPHYARIWVKAYVWKKQCQNCGETYGDGPFCSKNGGTAEITFGHTCDKWYPNPDEKKRMVSHVV